MNTHDVLAFSVASEAVRQIRTGTLPWATLFSLSVYATASRAWPMPDFVIYDPGNNLAVAGEFKPPNQSKREYLTGLGQALAYTRDFDYSLLIIPDVADDGYQIANHVRSIMHQNVMSAVPMGLLCYDPRSISSSNAQFSIFHPLAARSGALSRRPSVDQSFWAKWRDASPMELGLFLEFLYEEGRPAAIGRQGTIRDRAFDRLWIDMISGNTRHWSGGPRSLSSGDKEAWGKNYRNFVIHVGWSFQDGKLTEEGLSALRIVHQYGSDSQLFLDHLALAVLLGGKHLVLLNAINEYQEQYYSQMGPFPNEQDWLQSIEDHLDSSGYLRRNPNRRGIVTRGFLKAEKTLWRQLGLIVPAGARVYHQDRGFIFNWSRISSLLT